MKRKSFLLLFLVSVAVSFVGIFAAGPRLYRIHGYFTPDVTWTGGHPGKVTFDIDATNSGYAATINESGYLSGFLWLGNVGWATFNHDEATCRAQVVCPENILQNPNQICPVYGCVWSQNAGWITMSGSDIGGSYTGVYYNPNTARIDGYGWNKGLGWIPFYSEVGEVTGTSQSGITASGLNINFVGKIAIIGNIAGTRIFDVPNQNVGYVFNATRHSEVMNTIHKNVAILSRNVDDTTLADVDSAFSFLVKKDGDYAFNGSNPVWPTAQGKRTIFVIGYDVILDTTNFIGADDGITRAIVALKDYNGNGGNIIVTDKVKRIYTYLYAEGSIFSGEKDLLGNIVPYVASGALNIPANQLYLKGLLVSKNTIGGAQQTPTVCPVVINECTVTNSQFYDLNYFRTYDSSDGAQQSLPAGWVTDPRLQNAPMVIEYNSAILSDPPPGLVSAFE